MGHSRDVHHIVVMCVPNLFLSCVPLTRIVTINQFLKFYGTLYKYSTIIQQRT